MAPTRASGRRLSYLALISLAFLAAPGVASATTFTVARTDDPTPAPCSSDCSLREAVIAANAGSGGDTIVLRAGVYRLMIPGTGEDAAATGDLDLLKNVTIKGAGARATAIDAQGTDRIFDIQAGVTAHISDLTLTGGQTISDDGGAIKNAGTLGLTRVAIRGNHADLVDINGGGGIESTGSLTVDHSLIANNSAYNGGGIEARGTFSLTDSTVSGNTAGGANKNGDGGGIERSGAATITLLNDTVAYNQAFNDVSAGAGIDGAAMLKNTIVADNVSRDPTLTTGGVDNCSVPTVSQGHNLSDSAQCALTATGDRQGVDPKLGPLDDYGGSTDTHPLLAGSPAINHGDNSGCPSTDQRGIARLQGPACDIGAFEFARPTVTITTPAAGAHYTQGARVPALFTCAEAGSSSLIVTCKGRVSSGQPINTAKPGTKSFTVTATDRAGNRVSKSVHYTVKKRKKKHHKKKHH